MIEKLEEIKKIGAGEENIRIFYHLILRQNQYGYLILQNQGNIKTVDFLRGDVKTMTAKQTTFNILDGMRKGEVFRAVDLTFQVNMLTGRNMFPDSVLRYLREYRTRRPIENISKQKSIYRMAG